MEMLLLIQGSLQLYFSSLSKKEGAVDTDELHQKKVTAGNPFVFESNVRELRQDCLSRTKQKGS